ncbi:serine/threonine-protein kinase [Rhodococcus oxybenzonivorans]|uniref:serine/threonine-protein kinase n=1 Tax=Rhodococcus TaxID=1827 RepID=UPI0013203BA1|nr:MULTISPECIES: serine/threonine-protein kinase [Rhodococcus]MDV7356488.1 serine/threonine-protein kinase [Rhodococcus oxybenzonivorans]QHE67262.1 serine/threonine protein kinase [Rhodococcus sp. WAY2]
MTRGNGSGRDRSAAESTSAEETVGVQNSDHESSEATVAAGPSPVSGERTMSAQLGGERTVSAQLSGERTAAAPTIDGERTAAAPTLGAERPSEGSRTVTAVPVDTLITRPPTRETLDDVEVGQQVDDFDLLMGLGSGAFGRVFLARQRSMQRLVAVKISHDHGNEPQTLAQLDHDYIVRVFDQRLLEDRKLRLLYMQYLPGGTLLRVLRRVRVTPERERNGSLLLEVVDEEMREKGEIRPTDSSVRAEIASLTWPETIAWLGRRLADALDYAGKRGVLHRDIKPANILLTAEGVPKLADFNISFSDSVSGASPLAYFGGSLAYMSPEQLEACHRGMPGTAADLDTRSDIFALGVMLWELMCGRRPFPDEDVSSESLVGLEAMLDHRSRAIDPEFLDHLPYDCPASLRRVLLTCLSPKPEGRWSSGAELAKQFDLCLNPRARDLVDPPPHSWRMRLRRWALPILVVGIAAPNALAGIYNYHHNKMLIISALTPEAQRSFEQIQLVINSIAFPLGAILLLYWCRYPLLVPRGLRKGRTYDRHTLTRARTDTLLLGDRVVLVVFGLWFVAGVAYPISLQLAAGGVPPGAYVHFIASLIVCGAVSVAYPFFVVAFFAVRCIYPSLLPQDIASSADAQKLRGLDRRSTLYLAVAASVPLAGVAGVTFLSPDEITLVIIAVRILCLGGIVAFVGVYWLFRQLEEDLRALEPVVSHESVR